MDFIKCYQKAIERKNRKFYRLTDMEIAELYLMDNANKTSNTSYFLNEVKSRVLHVSQCVRFNKFKSNTQSEFCPT